MVDEDPLAVLTPLTGEHHGSYADRAYEMIRNAILDGSIPPGTRIVEEALARRIEISRAPLRDAVGRLRSEGLLVDESERITRVVSLTPEAVRELHLIRTVLETIACQYAARHLTSEDVEELQGLIDAMRAASDMEDRHSVAELDFAFHRRLCEASRLPRLVAIWQEQQVLFRLWLNLVGDTLNDQVDHIAEAHQEILDAVVGGDDDAIFTNIVRHVYFVAGAMATERRRWASEQPRVGAPIGDISTVAAHLLSTRSQQ